MPSFPYLRYCVFACTLVLSACGTLDGSVASGPSGTAGSKPPAKEVAPATRAVPGTPFADDEARRTVYFGFGETTIDAAGLEVLRQNAQRLKEDPRLVLTLVGHTDNLGSAAYNLAVADKRTEAVSEKLRSLGVPRNQLRRLPRGSEQSSKDPCDSEACRQAMRKVELVYEKR